MRTLHLVVTTLVGSLSLVACGGADDHTIDRVLDACAPIALVASPSTELQRAGIDHAIGLWADVGISTLDTSQGTALEIRFEAAAPAFRGLYDDEQGIVYINSAIDDPAVVGIVLAHEVGHAFGLSHVDDRTSLMNRGNVSTPPTATDRSMVATLWGDCSTRAR